MLVAAIATLATSGQLSGDNRDLIRGEVAAMLVLAQAEQPRIAVVHHGSGLDARHLTGERAIAPIEELPVRRERNRLAQAVDEYVIGKVAQLRRRHFGPCRASRVQLERARWRVALVSYGRG